MLKLIFVAVLSVTMAVPGVSMAQSSTKSGKKMSAAECRAKVRAQFQGTRNQAGADAAVRRCMKGEPI